ncbi:MAG: glutamyl-tRNA reductase [Gammaproteobacteria bacterium]|nr:glutamyl-tRNA reductase [Gammaproteobacteria bacterium]
MALLTLGINHRTASIDLREKVSFSTESMASALQSALKKTNLTELTILSTCNRTELYCARDEAGGGDELVNWLADYRQLSIADLSESTYLFSGNHAVRHALRVASGLDSMVLGEPQILGQMKSAYSLARNSGAAGSQLSRLFQHSFSVAKQVRTDTEIGRNPVSIAFAATNLAKHIFTDLRETTALLIGAGEMIELVAKHLSENGVSHIMVANRTLERAHSVAENFGGKGFTLEELPCHLHEADIVISSTASPVPILGKGAVESALKKRKHKPIFMVDIAVPRDIEPQVAELEDIYLYTVDDLQGVVEDNMNSRKTAAAEAEKIIESRVVDFMEGLRELDAVKTLRAYRQKMDVLKQNEMEKALRNLRSGLDPEEAMARFAHSLSNKIMHEPSQALKKAGVDGRDDLLEWAQSLFGLSGKQDNSDLN